MAAPLKLTPEERSTALWLKLTEHYRARLAELRAANDGKTSNEIDTAFRRGRIAEVKDLLAMGDDKPSIPTQPVNEDF